MADALYLLHIVCKRHYQLVVWYVYANINLYTIYTNTHTYIHSIVNTKVHIQSTYWSVSQKYPSSSPGLIALQLMCLRWILCPILDITSEHTLISSDLPQPDSPCNTTCRVSSDNWYVAASVIPCFLKGKILTNFTN